jgi:hypothetical protein
MLDHSFLKSYAEGMAQVHTKLYPLKSFHYFGKKFVVGERVKVIERYFDDDCPLIVHDENSKDVIVELSGTLANNYFEVRLMDDDDNYKTIKI